MKNGRTSPLGEACADPGLEKSWASIQTGEKYAEAHLGQFAGRMIAEYNPGSSAGHWDSRR